MRAEKLLANRTKSEREEIGELLRIDTSDVDDLMTAFRSESVIEIIREYCTTPLMREDLDLLVANPFDPVRHDELVDADLFRRLGVIERVGDEEFSVNVDFALSVVDRTALEFGFAATLLARIGREEFVGIARAWEVGPRTNEIDYLLAVASEFDNETALMRQVANLRESDRSVLLEALEVGELPDDLSNVQHDTKAPRVRPATGRAGQRGLVFRIDQPQRDIIDRLVVPIGIASILPDVLKRVPPLPDTVVRSTRGARGSSRRGARAARDASPAADAPKAKPTPTLTVPGMRPDPAAEPETEPAEEKEVVATPAAEGDPTGPLRRRTREPSEEGGDAQGGGADERRRAKIEKAAAVVKLDSAEEATAAAAAPTLAADVLFATDTGLVVLRAGADVAGWATRCGEWLHSS